MNEREATDRVLRAIESFTSDSSEQESANFLAEIGSQIEAMLDALKEEGFEPE